jgi:hypothetical protein
LDLYTEAFTPDQQFYIQVLETPGSPPPRHRNQLIVENSCYFIGHIHGGSSEAVGKQDIAEEQ